MCASNTNNAESVHLPLLPKYMPHHPSSSTHLRQLGGRLCGTCMQPWHTTPHPNGAAIERFARRSRLKYQLGRESAPPFAPQVHATSQQLTSTLGTDWGELDACALMLTSQHVDVNIRQTRNAYKMRPTIRVTFRRMQTTRQR